MTETDGNKPDRPKKSRTPEAPINQPLGAWSYVVVSFVAILLAVAMLNYFAISLPATSQLITQYVLIVILGLGAAGFLFGVLRSFAHFIGRKTLGSLELGGPVVGCALGPVDEPLVSAARLMTEYGEARKGSGRTLRLCKRNQDGRARIRIVSSIVRHFPDARRV
jgi:hypothetical protein